MLCVQLPRDLYACQGEKKVAYKDAEKIQNLLYHRFHIEVCRVFVPHWNKLSLPKRRPCPTMFPNSMNVKQLLFAFGNSSKQTPSLVWRCFRFTHAMSLLHAPPNSFFGNRSAREAKECKH